jgi:REP element-mobilizing transposase RayT
MSEFKRLYHLQVEGKPSFITFNAIKDQILDDNCKDIILRHILFENDRRIHLYVAVVMPDHVHLIFTALNDKNGLIYRDGQIIKSIKGISAREINRFLNRTGNIWQKNYFDHYIRDEEELQQKVVYVVNNPVESRLVQNPDEYPWLWRRWVEGEIK